MTHKVQIDGTVREATAEEAAAIDKLQAEAAAQEQAKDDALNARNSATAKLKALGLTDKEIAALMGV